MIKVRKPKNVLKRLLMSEFNMIASFNIYASRNGNMKF